VCNHLIFANYKKAYEHEVMKSKETVSSFHTPIDVLILILDFGLN
jgi:hypothetical protein